MFTYNPQAKVSVLRIGQEQSPLVLIDDFVSDPQQLIEYAQNEERFHQGANDFYPGVRKNLPPSYAELVQWWLETYLAKIVHLPASLQASVKLCALSVANQDPLTLLPIQRIPHFDTCNNSQWAMVHFLCDENFGGTGFFRHNSSGFECISPERQQRYLRLLNDDASNVGLPVPGYLQGSNGLFAMTHEVAAKFNRAILYPSNLLHCGLIEKWQSHHPSDGRLTANIFCELS